MNQTDMVDGYKALRKKNLKKAYKIFEMGLRIKDAEKKNESLLGLGITYKELGENEIAIGEMEKALEYGKEKQIIYYDIGNIYFENEQYALAIQNYDMAIKSDSKLVDAYVNRGISWYNIGDMDQAINDFKNAIRLKPTFVRAISNLGICYLDQKKYEKAIDHFDRTLERDPENIHALCGKGLALFNMDQYDESIICFDAAITINPDFYIASYYKGHILRLLDLNEDSLSALEETVRIRPHYSLAWFELGELRSDMGDIEGSIKAYRNAIKYQKVFFEEAHFKLGKILLEKKNDINGAIKQFKSICKNNPYVPSVWYEMGVALSRISGKEDKAIASLKNVLNLDQDNIKAIQLLAELYSKAEMSQKAIDLLKKSMEKNPNPLNGLLLAQIYYSMGRNKEAVFAAEDALNLDPLIYDAWLVMGRSYGRIGRKEEYKQCLRKYLNNKPNDKKVSKELKNII